MAKRIECVALKHRTTQRQVQHTDVVGTFELYRRLDGGNHAAVCADAVLIEGTEINKIHIGGNPFECVEVLRTGGIRSIARDDTRDVGTVTVFIVRFRPTVKRLAVQDTG